MAEKPKEMANVSRVLPCDCQNRTQDRKLGEGNRLHFQCEGGWRCVTCKKVKALRKGECYFCKEFGHERITGGITVYLSLPMCPYHRKCAEEGFEGGMKEYGLPKHEVELEQHSNN